MLAWLGSAAVLPAAETVWVNLANNTDKEWTLKLEKPSGFSDADTLEVKDPTPTPKPGETSTPRTRLLKPGEEYQVPRNQSESGTYSTHILNLSFKPKGNRNFRSIVLRDPDGRSQLIKLVETGDNLELPPSDLDPRVTNVANTLLLKKGPSGIATITILKPKYELKPAKDLP
jgi:hypothetical protein